MRFIELDRALAYFGIRQRCSAQSILETLNELPITDIIYCKECKHKSHCTQGVDQWNEYNEHIIAHKLDVHFCSQGERNNK